MRAAAAALALLLAALPAAAAEDDFVVTEGLLSDEDFYRLVACGAAPGKPCAMPFLRWPRAQARALGVALRPAPPGIPAVRMRALSRALDLAIAEINGVGAAIMLRRLGSEAEAPVTVQVTPARMGEPIRGTGIEGVDGDEIGAALVTVWWNRPPAITAAAIVIASDVPLAELRSVMLEELTQALGLLTDIRNPAYEGVSIFSEDANTATRLGPQDRMAILRHYPPPP